MITMLHSKQLSDQDFVTGACIIETERQIKIAIIEISYDMHLEKDYAFRN